MSFMVTYSRYSKENRVKTHHLKKIITNKDSKGRGEIENNKMVAINPCLSIIYVKLIQLPSQMT